MKKIFFIALVFAGLATKAQVGIGVAAADVDASAQLEVKSTTKGLLSPRMTEAQKNAISNPATGLFIYQTDGTSGFYYFDGSVWKQGLGPQSVSGGAGGDFVDLTNSQTIDGYKTFTKDIRIKDLNLGHGGFDDISDVAFGNNALISNQSGTYNVAIGQNAAHNNNSGSNNVVIGSAANYYNESSSEIVAVGNGALHAEKGAGNVAVGAWAGHRGNISDNLTNSVFLGRYASAGGGTIDNSVALGNGANVDASNTIQLGNSGITSVKTSGTVTATGFKTPNGSSSEYLMADGSVSSGSSSATHAVGDSYGGGIVFYVTPDGMHGLISETQLISPNTNSTSNNDIYNYSQAQNMISNPNNHSTNGKLFTDWRLPTSYEFSVLYANKSYFSSEYQGRLNYYNWTSTPAAPPYETSKMVFYYFGAPSENGFNGGPCGVIAVRSF